MSSDLNDYIHGVLETGDHGPYRIIEFDIKALNIAIDVHAKRIAKHIQDGAQKIVHELERRKQVTVHNYLGNIHFECTPTAPKNLEELIDVMVTARREKKGVRAVGAFHAWSPVCVTPDYLVKTDNLVGTHPTPTAALKDPSNASAYYDVLCGTTWKQAAVALEKDGRALMNIGGFSGLHVLGATSTGTHGSGLKIPPLAGMIRGATLVSAKFGPDGKPIVYRIEPTNGITDPKKHSGSAILLQDDETFNAVIVGLCAFGVVYSVTIETLPFYWVIETRKLVDWQAAKKLFEQGPDGDILKYHNSEVWINAYTQHALITRRDVTTIPPKDASHSSVSLFATLIKQLPALKTVFEEMEVKIQSEEDDVIFELGQILGLILKAFSLLIPFGVMLAVNSQDHKTPKIGKYYDIYDIGLANSFPAISIEISYPMSAYIAATESAFEWLENLRKSDSSKALAGFLSLRFTAGIGANLSMSYSPNPTTSPGRCYLEIFSLFALYNSIQGFDEVVGPIQETSIQKFQGRLHWGQYLTPSFTALKYKEHDPEFYESISSFKKIAERFDPEHIMWNDFMFKTIWSVV